MNDVDHPGPDPSRRLRWGYLVALSLIACMVIGAQGILQQTIRQQDTDARVINVAGQQRMLSQRLAKAALMLRDAPDPGARDAATGELAETLARWERSHRGLRQGDAELGLPGRNSATVQTMYQQLDPPYMKIRTAALVMLGLNPLADGGVHADLDALTQQILDSEREFLPLMDQVVSQYAKEARTRIARLRAIVQALMGLTLLVLLLEALLIFEPARRALARQWTNLTDQRDRLNEALAASNAANLAKSRFLNNVSHEIRNPMTAILGCAELLEDADLTPEQRAECLASIQNYGHKLVSIIDDILELAAVEADRMRSESQPVELAPLVSDTVGLVRHQAERQGLGLAIEYTTPAPVTITTDPQLLRQGLARLLDNALKFTDRGEVTLRVSLESREVAQPRLAFAVRDTGAGIAPTEGERLFEPFAQGENAAARRGGGVGLGLAIARRCAQALGGDIEWASEPGIGSTFTLWIDPGPIDLRKMTAPFGSRICRPRNETDATAGDAPDSNS